MAIAYTDEAADHNYCSFSGTATANSDASKVLHLPIPLRTFTVTASRPTSGNFSFTFQGSLDGASWFTLLTLSAAAGTTDIDYAVDKPVRHIKVVFTDVDTSTVTWHIVGVK